MARAQSSNNGWARASYIEPYDLKIESPAGGVIKTFDYRCTRSAAAGRLVPGSRSESCTAFAHSNDFDHIRSFNKLKVPSTTRDRSRKNGLVRGKYNIIKQSKDEAVYSILIVLMASPAAASSCPATHNLRAAPRACFLQVIILLLTFSHSFNQSVERLVVNPLKVGVDRATRSVPRPLESRLRLLRSAHHHFAPRERRGDSREG